MTITITGDDFESVKAAAKNVDVVISSMGLRFVSMTSKRDGKQREIVMRFADD